MKKGKYRIKYTYDTGDSLNNSYDNEDHLELSWDNIDIAKENLKRIQEHYNQYKELDSYRKKKTDQEILEESKHKDWFVCNLRPCIFEGKTDKNIKLLLKLEFKHIKIKVSELGL